MSTTSARPVSIGLVSMVVAALGLAAAACGGSSDRADKPDAAQTRTSSVPSAKQLWVATDAEVATGRPAGPHVVRLSPDGKVVVVAGGGPTVAYDAASGRRIWEARHQGMSEGATWLALSPDGSTVYVTGTIAGDTRRAAYRTMAFSLDNGKRLWAATFKSAGARSVASVVATDAVVLVDGVTSTGTAATRVVTVAYDARTGAQRWVAAIDDSANGGEGWFPNGARSLAVNPDGTRAYVTTGSQSAGVSSILTVAYDVATGTRRWIARYASPDQGNAMGAAVMVSPDGSTLVMTGMSESARTRTDSVTIGYAAETGKQQWVRTYNGPANQNEGTGLVAFTPDGGTVFVAGTSEGAVPEREDMIVLAYATASGAQRWAVRWDGPAGRDDNASDLAVAPDGSSVVLVGRTVPEPMKDQFATVGLDPASGVVTWSSTYGITASAEGNLACEAKSVAIAADGTVFVTGSAASGAATVAYAPPA